MRDRLIELVRVMEENATITCPRYFEGITLGDCRGCQYDMEDGGCDYVAREADYLLANGVIVPPCKVGETVYYVSENPMSLSVDANTIYEAHVSRIVTTAYGTTLVIQIHNAYGCTEIPDVNEWGKTVFLTREEAEQALKGGMK